MAEVLDRVKSWPQAQRISLARGILETLKHPADRPERRGRPVAELSGLGAGEAPPPDDQQVDRWIEEYRMEKHS
jgi:hypothetical protein